MHIEFLIHHIQELYGKFFKKKKEKKFQLFFFQHMKFEYRDETTDQEEICSVTLILGNNQCSCNIFDFCNNVLYKFWLK